MKRRIIAVAVVAIVALGVYLFTLSGENDEPKISKTEDVKQLVQDYTEGKIQNQSASITSKELIVTDSNKKQTVYALPKDEFFVSIAPYINKTHPCATHSLTGCQGELTGEEFSVFIEDSEGNVVLDKTMKSQENGFIDLWLPRDKTYQVTIAQDNKTAKTKLSTFEDDNTCVTTMQLNDKSA